MKARALLLALGCIVAACGDAQVCPPGSDPWAGLCFDEDGHATRGTGGGFFGGGMFRGAGLPSGGGGGAADVEPVFDFNPSSGVANLTEETGWTTVIDCDARTATTTNWPCATGGTWTEADGDVGINSPAPFTEEGVEANDYDRFYSHEAPTTAVGEVTAGVDVSLFLIAFVNDRGAVQYVAGKYDTANSQGYAIRVTAGGVVQGIANATTFGSHQLDAFGEWNVYELRRDNDVCALYVNGVLSGSTAACSGTLATTTAAKNYAVGCKSNGTNENCIDGKVSNLLVKTCTGCGATAATLAAKKAHQVMGTYVSTAAVSVPLTTDVRASPAVLDIDLTCNGVINYFRVGARWLRIAKRRAESTGGVCKTGYLAEPGVTNRALQASVLGTTWTQITAGDSITANIYFSPLALTGTSDADMDRFVAAADAVGLEHGVRQAVTLTATTYTISAVTAYDGSAGHKQFAALRDNTIGATAIGFFDVKACVPRTQGAGLHFDAAGLGPYASARATNLGTVGGVVRCLISVQVDGTAAAHDIDFLVAHADGDTTFTTSASQNLLGGGLVMVTALDDGYNPTSFVPTTTATQTRNLDGLRYDISNYPASGTIVSEVLYRNTGLANGSTGNVAAYICVPYKDANNYVLMKATASTGQGVRNGTCTAGGGVYFGVLNGGTDQLESCGQGATFGQWCAPATNLFDGQPHHMRIEYAEDRFRGYVDGDQTPCMEDDGGDPPDLTGGYVLMNYESVTGTNQSGGLVTRCRFFNVAEEPLYP